MSRLLFLILFCSSTLCGEIFEIKNLKETLSYLKPETVVVFDIDDTLVVPAQMLGGDEWFQSRRRFHQENGHDVAESLEKSLAEWQCVRHLTKMQLVEGDASEIVRLIQDGKHPVMGLTSQGLALATRTKQHLLEYQIDLNLTAPHPDDHYFQISGHGVLYRSGILYASGRNKGLTLFTLFEKLSLEPKRILVIDDTLSHLVAIEKFAQEKGIEFIGLRYGFSDTYKAAFNKEIADFQFSNSTFTHILSDEEARKKLQD